MYVCWLQYRSVAYITQTTSYNNLLSILTLALFMFEYSRNQFERNLRLCSKLAYLLFICVKAQISHFLDDTLK